MLRRLPCKKNIHAAHNTNNKTKYIQIQLTHKKKKNRKKELNN